MVVLSVVLYIRIFPTIVSSAKALERSTQCELDGLLELIGNNYIDFCRICRWLRPTTPVRPKRSVLFLPNVTNGPTP